MPEINGREKRTRRNYLKLAGGASVVGFAGCLGDDTDDTDPGDDDDDDDVDDTDPGDDDPEDSQFHLGLSPLYMADDWMTMWTRATQWWADDHDIELTTSNPDADPSTQLEQSQSMAASGIDGLILSPADSEASATIVDQLAEEDIPVIASNSMSVSEQTKMFVAFDNYSAAGVMGEDMVDHLEEKHGEPRGLVLHVGGPMAMQTLVQRRDGFNDVLDEYPDIEVEFLETDALVEDAQNQTTSFLRTIDEGDLDGVYAHNPNMMIGAQNALEREGFQKERGDPDHVYANLFAANPVITDMILDGIVDAAINQGPTQYGPIALNYMIEYLESGKDDSVFPDIGDEVTLDDLTITGGEHHGVNLWEPAEEKQYWAPAEVVDIQDFFPSAEGSYPYFKTNGFVVTPDNADEPWLWGNVAREL